MNDNEMHIFKKILPEYLNHLKIIYKFVVKKNHLKIMLYINYNPAFFS